MRAYKLVFPGIVADKMKEDDETAIEDARAVMEKAKTIMDPEFADVPSSDLEIYEVMDDGDRLVASFYYADGEIHMRRPDPIH